MIRRFFTRVLMLLLIAACGYNWLQVERLQTQMSALQQQLSLQKLDARRLSAEKPRGGGSGWLGRAAVPAGLARAALARGNWKTAQRKISQGVDDLHHGVQVPQAAEAERRFQAMQAQLKSLQEQADALWRKLPPAATKRRSF